MGGKGRKDGAGEEVEGGGGEEVVEGRSELGKKGG